MVSGPDFAQVLHFQGGLLHRAAAAWDRLADRVQQRAEAMEAPLRSAAEAWQGPAGRAAGQRARRLQHTVDATVLPLRRHRYILSDLAYAGERLRDRARDLVAQAAAAGIRIGPDGSVTAAGADPEFARHAVATFRREVAEVVAEGARLDAEAVRRLTDDAPWPPGATHTFVPRSAVPEPDADPAAVHRWWEHLDPAQQRYLLANHPALIGALDGVPAAARDRANRTLLSAMLDELADRREELERRMALLADRSGARAAAWRLASALAEVTGTLRALELLRPRHTADGQPTYLLRLDTGGDGRVVLAVDNPDHADNILTYVPGTGAGLGTLAVGLQRTADMAGDATRAAPDQRTAAVYWLDYDAPGSLPAATSTRYADGATDQLRRYAEGMRVTSDGARHTVLGHSYGSTVIGHTAAGGLSADSLVFVGSPGVGVDSASQLLIDGDPAEDAWSNTASNDEIRAANPRRVVAATPSGWLVTRVVDVPDQFHGADPSSPGFGGQVFASDPRRHAGYWDDGNIAREHVARIVTGQQPDR
jgi:hypothetical protein